MSHAWAIVSDEGYEFCFCSSKEAIERFEERAEDWPDEDWSLYIIGEQVK